MYCDLPGIVDEEVTLRKDPAWEDFSKVCGSGRPIEETENVVGGYSAKIAFNMSVPSARFYCCLIAGFVMTNAGCIALNLPSERFHDPSDRGGLLGSWPTAGSGHDHAIATDAVITTESFLSGDAGMSADASCVGGDLEFDPFDTSQGEFAAPPPPPPEVPWPRFHPVPTRPVFGG